MMTINSKSKPKKIPRILNIDETISEHGEHCEFEVGDKEYLVPFNVSHTEHRDPLCPKEQEEFKPPLKHF